MKKEEKEKIKQRESDEKDE
jgi:hypothetical protein